MIHYVAEAEYAPDHSTVRWYIDLGGAGLDAVVAMINALGSTVSAQEVARCAVGPVADGTAF